MSKGEKVYGIVALFVSLVSSALIVVHINNANWFGLIFGIIACVWNNCNNAYNTWISIKSVIACNRERRGV